MTSTGFAQRLGAVAGDLAFADGPRLADEPRAKPPRLHLVPQRRRRQSELGCRLSEREHLAKGRDDLALERQRVVEDRLRGFVPPAVRARIGHALERADQAMTMKLGLLAIGACVSHLVSPFVIGSHNLAHTRYVVNTPWRWLYATTSVTTDLYRHKVPALSRDAAARKRRWRPMTQSAKRRASWKGAVG